METQTGIFSLLNIQCCVLWKLLNAMCMLVSRICVFLCSVLLAIWTSKFSFRETDGGRGGNAEDVV